MFKKLFYIILVVLVLFSFISCSYATDVDSSYLSQIVSVPDLNSSSDFTDNVSVVSNDSKVVSKFVASDGIFHEGDRLYDFSLVGSDDVAISGVSVNVKFLDYDYNLIGDYDLVTDEEGCVSVPFSFSNGYYFVFYEFFGNNFYSGSYGMSDIQVIPYNSSVDVVSSNGNVMSMNLDIKIPTSLLVEDTNIYYLGDVFTGRLVDYYGNPISGKVVDLVEMNDFTAYAGIVSVVTDEDGYFSYVVNKSAGVYSICSRFCGDDEYEYCQSLNYLNVSYAPNLMYLVNITNDGREIGIYKNNILYKYTYDCSVSGATKLVNNVLYFVSLDGSSYSLQNLSSVSQIKSSGISLFSNGKNILITYYGYTSNATGYFNVIFDGKTSGTNHICNLSLFYNENEVASLYFSSERNINTYAPVYTNLTLFNKNYNVDSIFYLESNSMANWEYLYYGDTSYGNYLNNADWSSNIGYESIQSYLISEDKITDNDMSYYLSNANSFSGAQRVAYENFLTALAYGWLSDKLADELACEYDVGWTKNGYPLIGTFIGINGRFISVLDTVNANSGINYQEFNNMYYLYGSLLEEYVMGLAGSESTCAVSEVFKGLLNGEEFYYYTDEYGYTILRLADNSSWLEFSPFGFIGSIINMEELQNKYNGGMCLGEFSYLFTSPLISNLELLTSNNTYGCKVILQDSSEITVGINLNWTEEEWDQVYGMVGDALLSVGFTGLAVTWEVGPFGWPVYLLFGGCIAGGFIFTALSHDIDQGFTWAKIKATAGDITVSYALDKVQG